MSVGGSAVSLNGSRNHDSRLSKIEKQARHACLVCMYEKVLLTFELHEPPFCTDEPVNPDVVEPPSWNVND